MEDDQHTRHTGLAPVQHSAKPQMVKWLSRLLLLAIWLVTLYYAFGFGGLAGMHRAEQVEQPSARARALFRLFGFSACEVRDTTRCGFDNTRGRSEVDCARFADPDPRRAVLFAFGQSNSANAGEARYTPEYDVVNFNPHDGRCYKARDPLLGPDGRGGSVWGRVGDQLIGGGAYDSVLVVPFGIGGTSITRWAPGGDLHARVVSTADQLRAAGIEATHVLWHQGESDAGKLGPDQYTELFAALLDALRGYGIEAPVYPAVATICDNAGDAALREAQRRLPERLEGVMPGPDTDALTGSNNRSDGCHFSAEGLREHARLWHQAITGSRDFAEGQTVN